MKKALTPFQQNLRVLWRGLRCRCPQCGRFRFFDKGWGNLRPVCEVCGLDIKRREADTWFVMYVSTAFITGLFLIALLWLVPIPTNQTAGRIVLAAAAVVAFFGTSPIRKGLATAIDYLIDLRWNNHEELEFRE